MRHVEGQDRAIHALQAGLATQRLHHAYVFHGPAGVGKHTTALAFAQTLLCHDRQTDLTGFIEPCGACASCKLFAATAAHPDLHLVNKELARYSDDRTIRERKLTTIPVDVLREHVIEPAYKAPQLNHGKVFLIDEAELLNAAGQNLLLKTLEEPPTTGGGTTIILVTASEDRLLPTIRSRCQRVAFTPLPDEPVKRWIDRHAGDLSEPHRAWLGRFADGSLGRAKLALDHGLTEWADTLLPMIDRLAQGGAAAELGEALAGMINTFAEGWVKRHDNASKEAANRLAAGLAMSIIAVEARRRLSAAAANTSPDDPYANDAALEPWINAIDALDEAESLLARNVNLALVCDHLMVALTRALSRLTAAAS